MSTFAQPLARALSTAAGSSAVVCQGSRRTYAELGSRCRRLAAAMRKLGLRPQDRIGVVSLNSDRYLELYLGLAALFYTSGTTGMIVSGGENIYSTEVEDALASTGPVSTPTSLEARGG